MKAFMGLKMGYFVLNSIMLCILVSNHKFIISVVDATYCQGAINQRSLQFTECHKYTIITEMTKLAIRLAMSAE